MIKSVGCFWRDIVTSLDIIKPSCVKPFPEIVLFMQKKSQRVQNQRLLFQRLGYLLKRYSYLYLNNWVLFQNVYMQKVSAT